MSRPGELVADIEARLRPLELDLAEAWWASNTQSSPDADEHRTRAELARRELLADAATFAEIRAARRQLDGGSDEGDRLLCRQLDILHDEFVSQQVPADLRRAIVELETRVESTFNNFRGTIGGRRVDDNTILEILRTSRDVAERREAWDASKQIGPEVADRVRELARLRNEAARASSATATTSRSRSRPASSTRPGSSPRSPTWNGQPTTRSPSGRPRSTRPWRIGSGAPPTSCGPGTSTTRSSRIPPRPARSPSTTSSTSRHRSAHRADLRRPRTRPAAGARGERPVRARRQEPARVLHRHRPRGRRPRAVQHRAERAVDGDDAPRVRSRDLRPRMRPHPSLVACARRATRSPPRASPCSSDGSPAIPRGSPRSPASTATMSTPSPRPRRGAARGVCSCSRAGCS